MLTLSYGYKKPQTGDRGSLWFPALEGDIQQLNDHNHDGVNSTKLTLSSFTGIKDTISHLNWVATAGGTYRQLVTTPANVTFDDYGMVFRITNGADLGYEINPTVQKVNDATFYVYVNDNTIDLSVLYMV